MRSIGYVRGEEQATAESVKLFAKNNGMDIADVFAEKEGEISVLRQLLNLVKLGACGTVVIPSPEHLSEDRYFRRDVELFFKRCGAKLVYMKPFSADCRHELMEAIGRYTAPDPEWGLKYGSCLPKFPEFLLYRGDPPYGYVRDDHGRAVIDAEAAGCVRDIFASYAAGESIASICDRINRGLSSSGERFGSITVRIILDNEQYLGGRTDNGSNLVPLISPKQWFAARERLGREYGSKKTLIPFFEEIYSEKPVSFLSAAFYRSDLERTGDNNVDTEALEAAIAEAVREFASPVKARAFTEGFVDPEREEANTLYPSAVILKGMACREFEKCLECVAGGDVSADAQARLERASDLRMMHTWRLRRIGAETELFSVKREEIEAFFERASRLGSLPREEQSFMAEAFVRAIKLEEDRAEAFIRDPASGTIVRRQLNGVLIPDSELKR